MNTWQFYHDQKFFFKMNTQHGLKRMQEKDSLSMAEKNKSRVGGLSTGTHWVPEALLF